MVAKYPREIDVIPDPSSNQTLAVGGHSYLHRLENSAIEAIQRTLGTDPGIDATVPKDAVGDGVADDADALLSGDADPRTMLLESGKVYRVGRSITLTGNTISRGGILRPDNGVTVTLNGSVDAGLYQWIDESLGGSVVLTNTDREYPEWRGQTGTRKSIVGRIGSPEGVALEDETGAEVLRVAGGAASGRVLDKGGAIYNATAFGALGDGLADDTAAIQATVDAAAATSGTAYLPGDHRVSAPIIVPPGVALRGAGIGATILRPDTAGYVIRVLGSEASRARNVSISDLTIDGSASYVDDPPIAFTQGTIRVEFADDVEIRNISGHKVHDLIQLRDVTRFIVDGITGTTISESVVTLFKGTRRGAVRNIIAVDTSEVVDTFENEDLIISGVVGVTTRTDGEGIDLSTVRRCTISDVILHGYPIGIQLKTETGSTAWRDITIRSVSIYDNCKYAITVGSYDATAPLGRLRIDGLTVYSDHPDSGGIVVRIPQHPTGSRGIELRNFDIDVRGGAVENDPVALSGGVHVEGWSGVVIESGRIEVRDEAGRAGMYLRLCDGARVRGVEVIANAIGTQGAIFCADSPGLVLNDYDATNISTGYGVRLTNCAAATVRGGRVHRAGHHGIFITATNASGLRDPVTLGLRVEDNTVLRWGESSAYRAAILIDVNGTFGSVSGMVFRGNEAMLDSAVAGNSHTCYSLSVGENTLQRAVVTGNLGVTPSAVFAWSGAWGALVDSVAANNVPAI